MLTDDQVKTQVDLIAAMLNVSPYFDEVKVEVTENEESYTVFSIGDDRFIEVRYAYSGMHEYLPGYNYEVGGGGDEGPSIEVIYTGKAKSFNEAVVKLVSRIYQDQLQVLMEDWDTMKSLPNITLSGGQS